MVNEAIVRIGVVRLSANASIHLVSDLPRVTVERTLVRPLTSPNKLVEHATSIAREAAASLPMT